MMRKKIIITSSVIGLLSVVWGWGVPSLIEAGFPTVVSFVKNTSGYSIDAEGLKVKTGFLPFLECSFDSLDVINPKEMKIVSLSGVNTRLAVCPLLVGKVRFSNLESKNSDVLLYLDEPILKNEHAVKLLKKIPFSSRMISLKEYRLAISPSIGVKGLEFSGDDLYYSNKNRERIFLCNTLIKTPFGDSVISANMTIPRDLRSKKDSNNLVIKNFNVTPVFDVFREFLPADITSASGVLNIEITEGALISSLENLKIKYKDAFQSMIFPEKVTCEGRLVVAETSARGQVALKGDGVNLSISALIKNMYSKNPYFEISSGVENTKSDVVISMLPAIHTEGVNLFYLKKTPISADVNGYVSIKGRNKTPEVQGDILVKNGYMLNPAYTDKKRTNARISLKGDKVFYNVNVGIGKDAFVQVDGNSELYNDKISKVIIKTSPMVDLSIVQPIVSSLEKIFYFNSGPVSIMNIKGFGNTDFRVEGSLINPHAWGQMNFTNATASFNDINGAEITNVNGFVKFDNQDVAFEFLDSKLDGNSINITGIADLYGKLKVDIDTKNIDLHKYHEIVKASPLLKEVNSMFPPVDEVNGRADIKLSLKGNVPDVNNVKLNENLFAEGVLKLYNTSALMQEYQLSNINGEVEFTPTDMKIDLKSLMKDSRIDLLGSVHNNIADIKITSPKLLLNDVLSKSSLRGLADENFISFESTYRGKLNDFEFDKLNLFAKILPSSQKSPVSLSSGQVNIKNGFCSLDGIKGFVTNNPFVMSAKIQNLGEKNQNINANINLSNASLSTLNLIREFYLIPKETKQLLRELDFLTGRTDIDLKVVNNKPYSKILLKDVLIKYLPLEMPIKIINGELTLNNNVVKFSKINTLADDMPIFVDGQISNIYDRPYHNIYVNSVPKQSFIDKYINKHTLYPLKIKGDIIYSAKLNGWLDLYNIVATAKLGERASLYYLGATVGDSENATVIDFNGDIVKNNSIKINNFEYNKIVSSQNNKQNIVNYLKMKGGVKLVNNEPVFQNLVVKTENPTDARIFNVIFKKPNIKQGLFTSDLSINGKLSDLKILGDFNIYEIDLPLLQTVLKSVALKFTNSSINIDSRGEVFSNNIKFIATAKNSLKAPFVIKNGLIHFDTLDLNAVIADLKRLEINKPKQNVAEKTQEFDIASLIIERLDLVADNVLIKGVVAKDLKSIIALSQKLVLSLSDYSMELANGTLNGDFNYNLLSKKADLLLNTQNIDANQLSIMLFDLSNQIYGNLTGTVSLACNATNDRTCASTLYGDVDFNVKDGRMPKLGSLEYLLKAGNLLKGGITGLSINSLVDIITPLKTGEFSDILGTIRIKEGIADDIKITTRGKDLNLYMKGDYNVATSDARMFVFGMLSREIKTPLGVVGNFSLNTLFNLIPGLDLESESSLLSDINKIPGIELSQRAYRKFMAEIRGDISGENYVKSFKWIN